jgi:toxin FitB
MFLLDTNVVSELRKVSTQKANEKVVAWANARQAASLFISVITIEEIEIGARLITRHDKIQGQVLSKWLHSYLLPAFSERILNIDTQVALRSAELHVPNPRPIRDSLIAATALVHKLQIVTRNVADFSNMGLEVLNPWQ